MKRVISFFVLILFFVNMLSPVVSFAENVTTVFVDVNGQRLYPDVQPFIKNGRTLIPLRGVFEKLGAQVQWLEDQRIVIVTYHDKTISLQIDSSQASVNGSQMQLDVPPVICDNRTMIPLRFISENMGMMVQWVPEASLATITDPTASSNTLKTTTLGFTTNDYHGDTGSYSSLKNYYSNINSIATFSYQINSDGKLTASGESQKDTIRFANNNNIKSLLLIHNYLNGKFDINLAHSVLSDPSKRQELINNMLIAVSKDEYAGVNVDIENVSWNDRDNYSAFIRELKEKFTPYGFLTTASIPSKTFDSYTNDNWSGAFDYNELGKYADQLVIMTYDEHFFNGSSGPVASISWVENVVKYATQTIPSNKILLGIAGYGYDWASSGNRALSFKNIEKLLSGLNMQSSWDDTSKSPYFTYNKDGINHEVWFENSQSLSYKMSLVKNYNLGGIGIWRLGFDNDEFWSTIKMSLAANQ